MIASDGRPEPAAWISIGSLWLGLGLFDAMQTVLIMHSEGMHHAWVRLFAVTAVSWLPWALATPLILQLGRRFTIPSSGAAAALFAHAAACLAIALVFDLWTTLLFAAFNPYVDSPSPSFGPLLRDHVANGMLSSIVLYAAMLTLGYGLRSRERLALAETEATRLSDGLSKAQLAALRRQIEPHFLFNALNAVAGLIREGRSDAAVGTIAALSEFLRHTLEDSSRQEVPLHEEMAFVNDYLNIQKVRFGDRLSLRIDVPLDLHEARVPTLILQPLVENAIKHGIAKRAKGGTIRIAASHRDDVLTLSVSNDGPHAAGGAESARPGIGLANVRERLRGLYGDSSDVRVRRDTTGGVNVTFSLPLRVRPSLV